MACHDLVWRLSIAHTSAAFWSAGTVSAILRHYTGEHASDGRAHPTALGGRSFGELLWGLLSSPAEERGTESLRRGVPGVALVPRLPRATFLNPWRGFRDGAHGVREFLGGGVALATESARWPYGELCWPAVGTEHLHREPRLRHGAAFVRARSARRRNLAARNALTLTLPA